MKKISTNFNLIFNHLIDLYENYRFKQNSYSLKGIELRNSLERDIEEFEPQRFELMNKLGNITANFTEDERNIHREFIWNTDFHKHSQHAPFYWRIINKPSGYAGDAEMMNMIYRNDFEGVSPYGMFLHKHAVETKACEAVRNRREFLKNMLLAQAGGQILSLAAGPAREIHDVLKINKGTNHYRFLALDHDIDTLRSAQGINEDNRCQYAIANAFQIIKGDFKIAKPIFINFCNPQKDFKGLNKFLIYLKYKMQKLKQNHFDFVYSAGLFDYIKTFDDNSKGSIALTKNLFDLVKPGGKLIIGNFSNNNPKDLLFPMEYIYDWILIYRNKEEMLKLANAIPAKKISNIQVLEEPLGINYFLKITKK
jgi:extracellular factor (EF) 3-hydroxypalmitic acid methyl ester biosynthesis protein